MHYVCVSCHCDSTRAMPLLILPVVPINLRTGHKPLAEAKTVFRGQATISGVILRLLNRIAVFGCALRSSGRFTAHSPV